MLSPKVDPKHFTSDAVEMFSVMFPGHKLPGEMGGGNGL